MGSDQPAVDWASLEQLISEVGKDVLPRLLRTFYGEATTRLAAFRNLSQAGSPNGEGGVLHREVHSLKSAAGSFGAAALAAGAAALEVEIETGRYAHDEAAINQLVKAFDDFRNAVIGRGIVA